MSQNAACRECGSPLSPKAAAVGLCTACLLKAGMEREKGQSTELASTSDDPVEAQASDRIGKYRILERLGEGGMGEVYLAEQKAPRRKVALKVIKRGMDTKHVIARFEAERQALALMDHPNIAKVFDAGATPHGRPYFVMEYVKGVPFTEHCDRQRMTTRQRLELFAEVCEGVQHAHQKAVIHRDIKPSNVLVTIQEGRGVPKIIDFGVAKATAQPLTEDTLYTALGQIVGTPEYMSPEQTEVTSQDIDTRTDVYSLGVLLYELMVGVLPFDSRELRKAGFDEIRRRIREDEPAKPSTRLTTLGGNTATTAQKRQTDPEGLVRRLRGDLDWIVMKSLEKDRTRRYSSASELAADVRRHLSHEPVLASPPSTAYRIRKFVKRHSIGVAAGVAVVLALVLGFGAATIGLVRAVRAEEQTRQEAERANREAERASQEAETAKQVSEFMIGLFEVSDPGESRGNTITAREILDRGAEQIETVMSDTPTVQARMMATMGYVYRNLGLYRDAEPLLIQSLETRRSELGEDHPETLESIRIVGHLLQSEGKLEEAEDHYEQALEGRRRVLGNDHKATIESINDLGVVLAMQGKFSESEPYVREALEANRRLFGDDHPDTLNSLNNIAQLMVYQGKPSEAEAFQREALKSQRRTMGDDHPATLRSINNIGYLLLAQGKLEETLPFYREALEGRRRVLGDDHPETLSSVNNMGFLLASLGKLAEAEPFYREALDTSRRVLGPDHSDTIQVMGNLGDLYTGQARFDAAIELLVEARAGAARALTHEHPITGMTIRKYGRCLTGLKRYDDAEPVLLEAHEILVAAFGPEHGQTRKVIANIVDLYEAWGQSEKADEWRGRLPQA